MVILKTYHWQIRCCKVVHKSTKGFIVELIPVILCIEMPACDVVEPNAHKQIFDGKRYLLV